MKSLDRFYIFFKPKITSKLGGIIILYRPIKKKGFYKLSFKGLRRVFSFSPKLILCSETLKNIFFNCLKYLSLGLRSNVSLPLFCVVDGSHFFYFYLVFGGNKRMSDSLTFLVDINFQQL